MKNWEVVIGLEIHAELKTNTKLFCRCKNDPFGAPQPNTYICPLCLGLPGTLPVLNARAVEWAIKVGLAIDGKIRLFTKWDRKNYFYPDLPKGYQISQYDLPIVYDGALKVDGVAVPITRIHLEEDAGKLIHPPSGDYSLVDYNRAGVPLLELVTAPSLRSAPEARRFAEAYQRILRYLGVSSAEMEKGEMRVEANISLRPVGSKNFGVKVEVKNLNSFRSVERAIHYEVERQGEQLARGEAVTQETRGFNEAKGKTFLQRIKESAEDYRYFPDPDLPPVRFTSSAIAKIKGELPELPSAKLLRYQSDFKLSVEEAEVMLARKEWADNFEELVRNNVSPKLAANWLIHNKRFYELSGEAQLDLMRQISNKTISVSVGKEVLEEAFSTKKNINDIIKKRLSNMLGGADLEEKVSLVVREEHKAVQDFIAGKPQAKQFLIGKVLQKTQGKAEPAHIIEILGKVLGGNDARNKFSKK